eukprot:m.38022 g.38022  ORF g.38022 m.38022 type:complete len:73 (+) comp7766_c0_seq2:1650-1868(+)
MTMSASLEKFGDSGETTGSISENLRAHYGPHGYPNDRITCCTQRLLLADFALDLSKVSGNSQSFVHSVPFLD